MYAWIDPECGRPGFLYTEMPKAGDRFDSSKARELDRVTVLQRFSPMRCHSCQRSLSGSQPPKTEEVVPC